MSFKDAIKNIKSKVFKTKQVADSEIEQKYEKILHSLIEKVDVVYSTAVKSSLPCIYIYVAEGVNIDLVQNIYAEFGIQLNKHTSKLDNKTQEVLFISTEDYMKLNKKQMAFFDRTAPTSGYRRQIELSVKKGDLGR